MGVKRGRFLQTVCHANEIADRAGLKLPHQVGPVQLHGTLPGAQLARDLFVKQALRYHVEHLTLPGSEQVEQLSELRVFRPLVANLPASAQRAADSSQQLVVVERLEQEVDGSRLHPQNAR